MPQNIEIKCRLRDWERAISIAGEVADEWVGTLHQTDTFWTPTHGRLKLREEQGHGSWMIWYTRSDEPRARMSDYRIVEVDNPAAWKDVFNLALPRGPVVQKRRELYLRQNVRIHLDQVRDLGEFLELEAVLATKHDLERGTQQVKALLSEFGVEPEDYLSKAYADLMLDEKRDRHD